MIACEVLEFSYDGQRQFRFPAFSLEVGEQLLISGASGSGKSTWLQLLAGWRRPQKGKVYLENHALLDLPEQQRASQVAVMHQNMHFIPSLNSLENVQLSAQLGGVTLRSDLPDLFEQLGLQDKTKQSVQTLSRGEQQRLSFIRALAAQPKVLLADEPTASLDDEHCHELIRLMQSHTQNSACSLIVISHDQRLKASIERSITL